MNATLLVVNEPKTEKGLLRSKLIVNAAVEIFIDNGYSAMAMRRVAQKTGMTLSNLQHYFPNKEALIEAVLESVVSSYTPSFEKIEKTIIDPKQRLMEVIKLLLNDAKKSKTEKLFVEIWSNATRDLTVKKILDRMYCHHRRNLEKYIRAANPKLTNKKISLRAALVAMQIEGLMLLISESKPQHPELDGLDAECLNSLMNLVLSD